MSKKETSRIMFSRREFLTTLGATAGLAALQAGCAPIATPVPTQPPSSLPEATATPIPTPAPVVGPSYGGTVTTAQIGDIVTFFPLDLSGQNWPYFNQLFNVLVRYDENIQPQPELAESWEFSEDGLSLTLGLRKGVLFHNGREFAAEDVVHSMERVKDESKHANIRPLAGTVESVEAKDKYTAVMHFSAPAPGIFDFLDLFFIMAHESFDEIDSNPIGTGPFKFVEWIPGEVARFTKFEDYWREGRPYLDEVIVRVIPDVETQLANLETDEVNMLFSLPTTYYDRVNETSGLRAFTGTKGALVYNFVLNCQEEPFTEKKVRQAMQWAIDRERIVQLAFGGVGEAWIQPVPQSSLLFDPDLEGYYTFDLDKAKELLAEAGYSDGLDVEIMAQSNFPEFTSMAEILQADLAKIGVNATITELEPAAMSDRRTKPEGWQMHPFFFGRGAKDPASLFGTAKVWWPKDNNEFYYNPEYERLANEGASTIDPKERREIYRQLAKIILEDSFSPVVSPRLSAFAVSEKLQGLRHNLDDMMILEDTWLEA
jgi:peptide/nickel transport system substrate-binding protein